MSINLINFPISFSKKIRAAVAAHIKNMTVYLFNKTLLMNVYYETKFSSTYSDKKIPLLPKKLLYLLFSVRRLQQVLFLRKLQLKLHIILILSYTMHTQVLSPIIHHI